MKNKKDTPSLETDTLEHILVNVFASGGHEPNTVPLSVLMSYSNYRKERYSTQKLLIILALWLFMLLPVLFICADVVIERFGTSTKPVYQITVSSIIPIEGVSVKLNDKSLPLTRIDNGVYSVTPTCDGTLKVSAQLYNRQVTESETDVSGVDSEPPKLIGYSAENGSLIIYVSDELSQIDAQSIIVTYPDGSTKPALGYDEAAGAVMIEYPRETVNVAIPDTSGNTLHLRLKPKAQND